jgi:hypothetical protein
LRYWNEHEAYESKGMACYNLKITVLALTESRLQQRLQMHYHKLCS